MWCTGPRGARPRLRTWCCCAARTTGSCTTATSPLPLPGPRLAGRGLRTPYVGLTHGAEVWQACVPGWTGPMRRALSEARAVTAISRYTAAAIRASLDLERPLAVLPPAVDERRFE